MGQPFGSTGKIEPSTTAYDDAALSPSTQRGSYSFTEPTGSPIDDAGIDVLTFAKAALLIVMLSGTLFCPFIMEINRNSNH